MDNNNWRPAPAGGGGGEPMMDAGDWRSQLQPDSRQRIINKIMDTLTKHLPFSGQEGLQELKKIAVRFEEKIYTSAISQPDYLRKISLKMLTMETKSQNSMPNAMPSNSGSSSKNPPDTGSLGNQGQSLIAGNQAHARQQLLSQNIQNNMAANAVQGSANLTSGLPTIGGLPPTTMPNGQNSNLQNIQNVSGISQNSVGNSMGQGVSPNIFANTQRQMPGRQQVVPQQQQSQNPQQQYVYQQQQLMKQKYQQGSIPNQQIQSHLQQQQAQHQKNQMLSQSSQLQPSQQSVMQHSVMQPAPVSGLQQNQQSSVQQSAQPMVQQNSQAVLRQQQQQQQPSIIHQQQTPMQQQQSMLPARQQQQQLMGQQQMGQQPNSTILQQNQIVGQQNSIPDMQQQQQQQQRLLSQQNTLTNLQQQQQQQQQQLMGQQNNLPNMHQQQQLGAQSNMGALQQRQQQQQQLLVNQSGNSSMQTAQHSVHMLQQSKIPLQQHNHQSVATLMPTPGQQSENQSSLQQQMLSQLQSQPGQLQQQGLQHLNPLQRDMQQRLQTSGPLLQSQNMIGQQKQLFQSQRPIPEVSSTSLDSTAQTGNPSSGDWQEEIYQKIKVLREAYFPELSEMYRKIAGKLQQPKNEQFEKLKIFGTMLERILHFLQVPKSSILPNYKEKLGAYEKQIVNFLNSNRPRKPGPSMQQGQQIPPPQIQSMQQSQQSQSQITQVHPMLENQMNPQLAPMNIQGSSVATMQQNNVATLQHNSLSSLSGVPTTSQSMTSTRQPSSTIDSGGGADGAAPTSRNKRRGDPANQAIINCDVYINLEGSSKPMRENVQIAEPFPPSPPKEPIFSCPICMGPFNEEMTTKCGHIFCKSCIKAAITRQGKCPTCRRKVTARDIHRVYLPTTN